MDPFIGEIRCFGFGFAPQGWAECNGQVMSISQYTALFSLLGTMYGGDGESTFSLPDLRGRVPIGYGQGNGLAAYEQGALGGGAAVALAPSGDSSAAHADSQPYLAINWCIALEGVYPPRP